MKRDTPLFEIASIRRMWRRKSGKGAIYTVRNLSDFDACDELVLVDEKGNVAACSCGSDDKSRLCPHIKYVEKQRARIEVESTLVEVHA